MSSWLEVGSRRSGGLRPCSLAEAELGDGDLPHPELLDLPRYGHRELGREPHVPGDLVGGNLPAAKVPDLVDRGRLAIAQADPRADLLAVLHVGHADHLHVADARMGVEKLLNLARIDVLAAADDHVLEP